MTNPTEAMKIDYRKLSEALAKAVEAFAEFGEVVRAQALMAKALNRASDLDEALGGLTDKQLERVHDAAALLADRAWTEQDSRGERQ